MNQGVGPTSMLVVAVRVIACPGRLRSGYPPSARVAVRLTVIGPWSAGARIRLLAARAAAGTRAPGGMAGRGAAWGAGRAAGETAAAAGVASRPRASAAA